MPSFHQTKILPYEAKELFCLILDIESYPEFLPWCSAARIISAGENQIIAELVVQLKGFSEKYQSRVTYKILDEGVYLIEAKSISGPFKYLKNIWQFSKKDQGTLVEFFIDFTMKSIILNKLIGVFFTDATEKMVDAFEKRAESLLTTTI